MVSMTRPTAHNPHQGFRAALRLGPNPFPAARLGFSPERPRRAAPTVGKIERQNARYPTCICLHHPGKAIPSRAFSFGRYVRARQPVRGRISSEVLEMPSPLARFSASTLTSRSAPNLAGQCRPAGSPRRGGRSGRRRCCLCPTPTRSGCRPTSARVRATLPREPGLAGGDDARLHPPVDPYRPRTAAGAAANSHTPVVTTPARPGRSSRAGARPGNRDQPPSRRCWPAPRAC